MKKKRKMISSLVAFMLLLNCLGTMSSAAAEPDMECSNDSKHIETVIAPGEDEPLNNIPRSSGHWVEINGKWKYQYDNGTFATNVWEYINGKWYHFDSNGWMQTGWLLDNNKWYYLGNNGAMVTGWKEINSKWYYFKSNGVMATGWQEISNNAGSFWYYFKSTGEMVTGWQQISNNIGTYWYYFKSTGAMAIGWQEISNNVGTYWYFFNPSGQMVTGWQEVLGYTYFFNDDGQLQNTTRRAIIVGNPDELTSSDVNSWGQCVSNLLFNGTEISSENIQKGYNITSSQFDTFIQNIRTNANESDITYISLTCLNLQNDRIDIFSDGYLTGASLHSMLEQCPGKIVIFLNCNYAGTVINRSGSNDESVSNTNFEDEFISAFSGNDRSGELLNNKYLVLCSCSYNGNSNFYNNLPQSCFWFANKYWMLGGGWNPSNNTLTSLNADYNSDSIVSLHELYTYSRNCILTDPDLIEEAEIQNVVVYPQDSNFTIFARTN